MTVYNWKQFTKRITIHSSPQSIYKAWATQDGLESWFLRLAEFTNDSGQLRNKHELIQRGDTYKWLWFGYDDAVVEQREILGANNRNELEFAFSGSCVVKVSTTLEDGETICELTQTMTMEDEGEQRYFFIECGKGWTFYLTNLKSVLEGGIDLRNKIESVKNVINA